MIKKYKEFLNEKLSDNLKGFNFDELIEQLSNEKIDFDKFFDVCDEYNIIINFDILKKYFLNGKLDFYLFYIVIQDEYKDIELPNAQYIKDMYLSGNLDIFKYYKICIKNNYKTPNDEEIMVELKKLPFDKILEKSVAYSILIGIEYALKQNIEQTSKNNALMDAFIYDNFDIIKTLIDNGAKIPNGKEVRCLNNIITSYNINLIKYVFDKFIFTKEQIISVLMSIDIIKNPEILEWLISKDIINDEIYKYENNKKISNKIKELILKYHNKHNDKEV